jgi:hypothetical protein
VVDKILSTNSSIKLPLWLVASLKVKMFVCWTLWTLSSELKTTWQNMQYLSFVDLSFFWRVKQGHSLLFRLHYHRFRVEVRMLRHYFEFI